MATVRAESGTSRTLTSPEAPLGLVLSGHLDREGAVLFALFTERHMPTAEHVERVIFQLFQRKLKHVGDEISGEELSQSRGFLPDGVTSADMHRGMEALIAKGYFLYYTHGYRHLFSLTPDGVTAMRAHTTRPRLFS